MLLKLLILLYVFDFMIATAVRRGRAHARPRASRRGRRHATRRWPMRENQADKQRRRGPVTLAELVGRVLDPVTARRGFATADLIAAWPEIVGAALRRLHARRRRSSGRAARTRRRQAGAPDPPGRRPAGDLRPARGRPDRRAGQRLPRLCGDRPDPDRPGAGRGRSRRSRRRPRRSTPEAEARLADAIAGVADEGLRAALDRLGRGVLADRAGDPSRLATLAERNRHNSLCSSAAGCGRIQAIHATLPNRGTATWRSIPATAHHRRRRRRRRGRRDLLLRQPARCGRHRQRGQRRRPRRPPVRRPAS